MVKFIKKTSLFTLPLMMLILSVVLIYGTTVPNLSNSLSFNAKMVFVSEKSIDTQLEVMAIGSSMTLNNIHSETIVEHFGPDYLNISSWGQSIEEDYNLVKVFVPRYKPKTLIVSSNFMDFENNPIKIKFDLLDEYVFEKKMLSGFDLRYNIKNSGDYRKHQQEKNGYKYLNYDTNGGVNLDGENFKVDPERWKGRHIGKSPLDAKHYIYLDSISNFCNANDITFVFVQSPFRKGFYNQLEEYQKDTLRNHVDRVNIIMNKNGHQFVNTIDEVWPDSLFVDYSHLNELGAKKYTELFLSQIK